MVEGIDQAQSLVEELLGLWIAGRNRVVPIAQPSHQARRLLGMVSGMILSDYYSRRQHTNEHGNPTTHRGDPP
jgi:hypothetical protein